MFFTNGGLRLFALEAGSGDPPLVFLHANGANHTGWHHQIFHFSKTHRVIAFDVRGQGESEADPNGDYSQETLANDLLAGMDAFGIEKAVLIGWSVGALTATRFAAVHPERALAVVLVDNAPAGDKIGVDPRPMLEYIKLLEDDFYGKGVEVYVNRWFPEEGPEIEELKRWCQAVCRRIGRESVLGIRVAGAPPDRLDLLSRLTVPTLILQGGASPGSGRPMGEYLHSIVPDSRLCVFEGKGHAPNLTAPDEFNVVLGEFIAGLAAGSVAPGDDTAVTERSIRRGFVTTSLGQVHYREAGNGEPLVLLHQSADSSNIYEDVIPYFADRYRVIAIDTPGFGESVKPATPPGIERYAQTVIELLDGLGIHSAALLGQHTGASIAVELAATYPDRVSKLVLVGCPDYDPAVRAEKLAGAKPAFTIDSDGAYLRWLWDNTAAGPLWTGWAEPRHVALSALNRLNAGPNSHFATLAVFEQDARTRIPDITCPVLLIHGDGDPFASRQALITPLFQDARHIELGQTSGVPMLQCPKEFASHVVDFLES